MHPAMSAAVATDRPGEPGEAFFYSTGGITLTHGAAHGVDEVRVVFGGGFPAVRPAVTQQFFPATAAQQRQQAVEQCVLAGAAVAASGAGAGRWGKQVYLGGFDTAQAAARAYDQAAIKFRGVDADINFSLDDYKEDIKKMNGFSKEEFVQVLRRHGAGFVRGSSRFRGVTLHKCGKWEARIGHLMGKKFVYLGLYDTEMDAARAYDKAALDCSACEGGLSMQSCGSEPDLELSLGWSSGAGDPTTRTCGGDALHSAVLGSRRTSLTLEMPEDEEETTARYPGRNGSIWSRPSSSTACYPGGDHHPSCSNMPQMGRTSGGGSEEAELHMLGWPTGGSNHWKPYPAVAASSIIRIPVGAGAGRRPRRPAAEPPPAGQQGAAVSYCCSRNRRCSRETRTV